MVIRTYVRTYDVCIRIYHLYILYIYIYTYVFPFHPLISHLIPIQSSIPNKMIKRMLGEHKNIHGPIAVNQYDFHFYLTALSIITLKSGPSTAEPADPYSKAFSNCGRILCLQYCWGKESNDELRDVKNRFCSFCSLICQKRKLIWQIEKC